MRTYFFERVFVVSLLILFSGVGAEHSSFAQVDQWGVWKNGVTESWWLSSKAFTKEEAANAIARWKLIGADEPGKSSESWAGDYFSGSATHGTYVRWSQPAGFVIADVDKCQALVMGLTYGRVNVTPTSIQFVPEFSKSQKPHSHFHPLERESAALSFIPVKWRDRLFLIPEEGIKDFSDYVAGLGDFNGLNGFDPFDMEGSYFYSRYAGKDAVSSDTPAFPDEYERFVKRPIAAAVTAIEGRKLQRNYSYEFTSKILSFTSQHELASLTFVKVNVGSLQGAKKGLLLRVSEPNLGETVRLIKVWQTSSMGVLVRDVDKRKETYYDNEAQRERTYPRVALGWKLTTARR
jgi:hypothetical protein